MSSIAFDASVLWMRATSNEGLQRRAVPAPLGRGLPRGVLELPKRLDDPTRHGIKDTLVVPESLHSNSYPINPTI